MHRRFKFNDHVRTPAISTASETPNS